MFKRMKKWLSFFCFMVLIAAMALSMTACNANKVTGDSSIATQNSSAVSENTVLGEGKTEFTFVVTDAEGKDTTFDIHTDKATVGEALLDVELIAGEVGQYGLMVTTVNGTTVDYDKDGAYWAFYVDGEYASTGVDSTPVTAGSTYAFKVEKG